MDAQSRGKMCCPWNSASVLIALSRGRGGAGRTPLPPTPAQPTPIAPPPFSTGAVKFAELGILPTTHWLDLSDLVKGACPRHPRSYLRKNTKGGGGGTAQ